MLKDNKIKLFLFIKQNLGWISENYKNDKFSENNIDL